MSNAGTGNGYVTKDSGERQTFSTGMVRDSGQKDLRPDLVFGPMLIRWAELMGRGAAKYGERNWEKAETEEELARMKASAFRHFVQWFYGLAPEEDHAAAVFFNVSGAEHVKARLAEAAKKAAIEKLSKVLSAPRQAFTPPAPEPLKPHVGAKVRIVNKSHRTAPPFCGRTGEITLNDGTSETNDFPWKVAIEDSVESGWFRAVELEVLSEVTTECGAV